MDVIIIHTHTPYSFGFILYSFGLPADRVPQTSFFSVILTVTRFRPYGDNKHKRVLFQLGVSVRFK